MAVQEKISSLILENRIKDKRVSSFISITKVDVSKDLSYADVYVSDIRGKGMERGVEGLQSAAAFIQSQIAASMRIRKTPRLRFHADSGIGKGFDLIQKIDALVANEGEKSEQS